MRRFIRAILATVTLALTIGFVPGFVPGSDPEANAGVVGPDVGDTMGFLSHQIEAAVYYPAITRGQEAHVIAVDVDDDGNVYSASNWAISRNQTGDLRPGAGTDIHLGYVDRINKPRVIVHKVDSNGEQVWSWELNGRAYVNYPHFEEDQNDLGNVSANWVGAIAWEHTGGSGEVHDIVVDDDGNTYVVGKWSGDGVVKEDALVDPDKDDVMGGSGPRDISIHSKTGYDGWIASIDPDGNTRWVKVLHSWGRNYGTQYGSNVVGYSALRSVDIDNNGSVVVAGTFTQTIHPVMDNVIDHPHDGVLRDWKNWTGNWDDTLPNNGMPNKALWDSSHDPEVAYTSTTSPYVAKLNASDGSHQWHYIWNTCQKNQASSPADVKFLSDGDIVLVGGYNYEARYQKYGEDCSDRSLDGETSQGMMHQRSQALEMFRGARSNIVKLSGGGDFMWGREFGSTNNVNVATSLAVDPNNDDLYIVGLWELWNDDTAPSNPMFTQHSAHYMAPSAPANHADYPEIPAPNLSSVNSDASMTASDHEDQPHAATCWTSGSPPCIGNRGQQVNQDTYLLHTDMHGNYITHETYVTAGVKEDKPEIDINSDGTELVIAGTGLPQCAAKHTSFRREAAGWVMGIDLETTLPESYRDGPADTNLSAKWITITEPAAPLKASPSCGAGVEMKDASNRWRDVAFGPNGNVYVGGGWYNQVKFGETAAGEEVISHQTWTASRADAAVVRYDSEGNVAGLTVPPPGNVAPDGYGIVTGPTLFEEDNSWGPGEHFLMDVGSEVVWHEPLCKGGRWEVAVQPEIAVRQYMILKQDLIDFAALAAPQTHDGEYVAAYIRQHVNNSPSVNPSTVPNYNILWLYNFVLEEDGGSSDWPDTFKLLGWDDGVADLDDPSDLPVGFYFRNGVFTYNTNSGSDPSVYEPATEVEGHSWDLDLYDTYLAFAHPGGGTQWMTYPEFEQKGCEPGPLVLCSGTSFDCDDTYGFTVSKDLVTTTEDGDSETFTVCLTGPTYMGFDGPTADVVMDVVNTDSTEVELSTDTLVFTPDNWDDCQTITVTGLDDSIPDGDVTSYVNIDIDHDASSYEYAAVPNQFVTVVNENGTEPDDLLPPPENDDLDGDGILNEDEVDGCVLLADCDGDGINDGNEIFACMLAADCDGDGVGDNDEISQACIQDPSCTDVVENPDDPEPIVEDPVAQEPPNPDPPEEPEIVTPDPPDDPQPPTPEPDPPIDDPEPIDTDGDGVPDELEEIGCETTPDCDGDGIPDDQDDAPGNPDRDNDGLPDGSDPDTDNPDTDGDGIPDGQDSDADGDGVLDCPACDRDDDGIVDGNDSDNSDLINPDNPDVRPGDDPNEPAGPSDTDDDDDQAPPPVQTPDAKSPGRGLADRLGDLPLAAVAATAALAVAAAAAAAASLAGPSLLSWLFRGSLGVWLFGLLFGRRGVRCSSCDLKLVKQAGLWVDKDTQWVVGINNHTHVPADFSDKDRDKYVTAVQQILQRSDR